MSVEKHTPYAERWMVREGWEARGGRTAAKKRKFGQKNKAVDNGVSVVLGIMPLRNRLCNFHAVSHKAKRRTPKYAYNNAEMPSRI